MNGHWASSAVRTVRNPFDRSMEFRQIVQSLALFQPRVIQMESKPPSVFYSCQNVIIQKRCIVLVQPSNQRYELAFTWKWINRPSVGFLPDADRPANQHRNDDSIGELQRAAPSPAGSHTGNIRRE